MVTCMSRPLPRDGRLFLFFAEDDYTGGNTPGNGVLGSRP